MRLTSATLGLFLLLGGGTVLMTLPSFSVHSATAADTPESAGSNPTTNALAPIDPGVFSLNDALNQPFTLPDAKVAPLVVVAFLGTECPLARQYALTLESIRKDYADKGVTVVAVNANPQDSLAEIAGQVRQQELGYPLLKDPTQQTVMALNPTRTPEVFVLDAQRIVRYRGRVDDQHGVGRSRPAPLRADLRLALDDLLANRPVQVSKTEPVGCLITRLDMETPAKNATVTWSRDIAPLMSKHCVECHQPGEIAPFALADYPEARGWAEMIREVVQDQRMPPWHADPAHGSFANERRLTAGEKSLIDRWVQAGAPEGEPGVVASHPRSTNGWHLPRDPDLVVWMRDKPFDVKASGEIRYQYFQADPGLKEDVWVEAAEVIPGNSAVVHHVIVFAAPPGQKFNGEGQFLTAYVPGLRTRPLPNGMAKRVPKGSIFTFQMHYTPNGAAQSDRTKIGLVFADPKTVTHEVRTESVSQTRFQIEPRKADQEVTSKVVTSPATVQLLSLSPHMHLRGQSFRYDLTWPDGRKETLLDVPHYDFNWQTAYCLKEPLTIPTGAKLQGFAKFDNSVDNLANPDPNATVHWGDQSWEEMMLGYFDIAIPCEIATLGKAGIPSTRDTAIAEALFKRLDKNKNGELETTEVLPEHRALMKELDADKNGSLNSEEFTAGIEKIKPLLAPRK